MSTKYEIIIYDEYSNGYQHLIYPEHSYDFLQAFGKESFDGINFFELCELNGYEIRMITAVTNGTAQWNRWCWRKS